MWVSLAKDSGQFSFVHLLYPQHNHHIYIYISTTYKHDIITYNISTAYNHSI